METVAEILRENERRRKILRRPFNPVTGEGSIGDRVHMAVRGFPLGEQWIPAEMARIGWVQDLCKAKDYVTWLKKEFGTDSGDVSELFVDKWQRVRCRHDFAFWAYVYVRIKPKSGGEDIPFLLNRPQRELIGRFEKMRLAGKPIRLVLLKARQWGGSTATQMYMAWLQLIQEKGLNSNIVGHLNASSAEVRGMFDKMIEAYPLAMLHDIGEEFSPKEAKIVGDPTTQSIRQIPTRNCKIKTGSAETPNSARGGDSALVHCTEVAFWKKTDGKAPEDIVRSACSGTNYIPMSMIVYESTANGTGNFFQREYDDAKKGVSQFESMFVAWWQIDQYAIAVDAETAARELLAGRDGKSVDNMREEPGSYYWHLWEMGATLEAIAWYRTERRKYTDHGGIAAEFPSDDIEAFVHSGARVFDPYLVAKLRGTCKPPVRRGELDAMGRTGKDCLRHLHFVDDSQGCLSVWEEPEIDPDERVTHRYLVVVDIGGRSAKADWSVILVIDRLYLMDNDKPVVVAQWYGHIDMDILAWKAAQISHWYDDALLVVESNTLETHDKDRDVDGDMSNYILSLVKEAGVNLYERERSADEIREGAPAKYGFHTNVKTKPDLIATLVTVVREEMYVERDERCLDEMLTYEKRQNGSFGAIPGKHDDLLMTRAIGMFVSMYKMDTPKIVKRARKGTARVEVNWE